MKNKSRKHKIYSKNKSFKKGGEILVHFSKSVYSC